MVNIFVDQALEDRLNWGGKRSQEEYSSKYMNLMNVVKVGRRKDET